MSKKQFFLVLVFPLTMFISGCGKSPEITAAEEAIKQVLVDPSSVEFKNQKVINNPKWEHLSLINTYPCDRSSVNSMFNCMSDIKYLKANEVVRRSGELKNVMSEFDKAVCLEYNAKNKMGGYVGFRADICGINQQAEAVCLSTALNLRDVEYVELNPDSREICEGS